MEREAQLQFDLKMNGLLSPAEFAYDDESRNTAGMRWPTWIRDFEIFLNATAVTKAAQRKAMLLHVVGKAAREIYYTKVEAGDTYAEVKQKLTEHFQPLRNVDFEIYKFGLIKQFEQEAFDDFLVRLRGAASKCDFIDEQPQIKRQITAGCRSVKL